MIDLQEGNIKVPEHIVRYVEYELYAYRTYKGAVTELEKDLEDIKNHSRQFEPGLISPETDAPGDLVSITALRAIMIEEKLKQQLWHVRKIEAGIEVLSPEAKRVVEKKYFSGLNYTNEEIIVQFRLNRNYYYKMRQQILYKFAVIFGVW